MALNVLCIFMSMLSFPTLLCKACNVTLPIHMYESSLLLYILLLIIVSQKCKIFLNDPILIIHDL